MSDPTNLEIVPGEPMAGWGRLSSRRIRSLAGPADLEGRPRDLVDTVFFPPFRYV